MKLQLNLDNYRSTVVLKGDHGKVIWNSYGPLWISLLASLFELWGLSWINSVGRFFAKEYDRYCGSAARAYRRRGKPLGRAEF